MTNLDRAIQQAIEDLAASGVQIPVCARCELHAAQKVSDGDGKVLFACREHALDGLGSGEFTAEVPPDIFIKRIDPTFDNWTA